MKQPIIAEIVVMDKATAALNGVLVKCLILSVKIYMGQGYTFDNIMTKLKSRVNTSDVIWAQVEKHFKGEH